MAALNTIWPEWRIEEQIGRGSFGKVYRISRESFGHVSYAAAKVIEIPQNEYEIKALASMGLDNHSIRSYLEDNAQSIINEIALMESLKGVSNIVTIEDYKLVEHENGIGWTIWIRMELLEGIVHYQEKHPPSVAETVKVGIDICNALVNCHSIGVVHRDVKPENVFRNSFGEYKLGDFGIARQMETMTRAMYSQKGTQYYMAPEVLAGAEYGPNVDVYSLGIMLYRYLNDMRFPFMPAAPASVTTNDLQLSLTYRLRGDRLPSPRNADAQLAAIVLKACEADPKLRYATAKEMLDDLRAWKQPASDMWSARDCGIDAPTQVDVGADTDTVVLLAAEGPQDSFVETTVMDGRDVGAAASKRPLKGTQAYPQTPTVSKASDSQAAGKKRHVGLVTALVAVLVVALAAFLLLGPLDVFKLRASESGTPATSAEEDQSGIPATSTTDDQNADVSKESSEVGSSGVGSLAEASSKSVAINGAFSLRSALNTDMAVTVAGGSTEDDAEVFLNAWENAEYQTFFVEETNSGLGGNSRAFTAMHSGARIDVPMERNPLSSGTALIMWSKTNKTNQDWFLVPADDDAYFIVSAYSGLCMNIRNGSTAENAVIEQAASDGGDTQKFYLVPLDISMAEVEVSGNGDEVLVSITAGGVQLIEGLDYDISYNDDSVTITGLGQFSGSQQAQL